MSLSPPWEARLSYSIPSCSADGGSTLSGLLSESTLESSRWAVGVKLEGAGGSFNGEGANRSFCGEAAFPILRLVGRGGILGTPGFDAVKLFGDLEGRGGMAGGLFVDMIDARQGSDGNKRIEEVKKSEIELLCELVTAQ